MDTLAVPVELTSRVVPRSGNVSPNVDADRIKLEINLSTFLRAVFVPKRLIDAITDVKTADQIHLFWSESLCGQALSDYHSAVNTAKGNGSLKQEHIDAGLNALDNGNVSPNVDRFFSSSVLKDKSTLLPPLRLLVFPISVSGRPLAPQRRRLTMACLVLPAFTFLPHD